MRYDHPLPPAAQVDQGRPQPSAAAAGYPLSFGQERLLWLHERDEGSAAYHLTLGLRFREGAVPDALADALAGLVARHEILRCRYVRQPGGEARQVPVDGFTVPLSRLSESEHDHWQSVVTPEVERPFRLAQAPPLRGIVVACRDGSDMLLLVMHHLVADGRSLQVLAEQTLI